MNELLFVVALVTIVQGGKPVGTATGFFYLREDNLYFVTNRHVVLDEAKGITAESLRVRLHADPNNLTKNVEREIPLYNAGQPLWFVHPNYAKSKIDIAIVKLDKTALTVGTYIKALEASNFLPERFMMNPGEDVMAIGFPRGFSDSKHNLPLIRNALVSSAYGIDFDETPMFLVDANLYPGMSGSPVLTRPKNIWPDMEGNTHMLTGSPTYFLGVFSATISTRGAASQNEALGLGTVWYGKLIDEIIASIK